MKEDEKYTQAISMLSERVQRILERVPQAVKASATEIRLRVDQPLSLYCGARVLFVDERGNVSNQPNKLEFLISRRDLQDNLIALSGWSVHTHQREMTEGYLAVRGGHRAGVAASAVLKNMATNKCCIGMALGILLGVLGVGERVLAAPAGGILSQAISMVTAPTSALVLLVVGYDLELDRRILRPVVITVFCRLALMAVLLVCVSFFVFRFVPYDRGLQIALMILYALPAPFIIPMFADVKEEGTYISTTLSLQTICTIVLFAGIAAYRLM